MPDEYKPCTWKAPEGIPPVDYSMSRQDSHEKLSGQAIFTRDVHLPGMLYAKILTLPYAHARIASIDVNKASALVGVRDILQFSDPDIALENSTGGYCASEYNILALPGTSDFFQHPMGVFVVADSEEICDRAPKTRTPFQLEPRKSETSWTIGCRQKRQKTRLNDL